ncbi:MAG: succinylglutamate desuccinylase/aspartoacylase family protein [Candidatus Shapirobacteria bacterium]
MSKNGFGIEDFYRKLKVSLGDEWDCKELGMVEKYPIWLITGKKKKETGKNLLIAGGFHGDEVAGVWGIIKFLTNKSKIPENINLAFLPLVNPTGFALKNRHNRWKQDSNRGFFHKRNGLSKEGKILKKNEKLILETARDGFLSLHEDLEQKKFYVYSFEKSKSPGKFSKVLMDAGKKYFGGHNNGKIINRYNGKVEEVCLKGGLCYKKHDGSFEDWLFHKGIKKTACAETPGQEKLEKRIEANVDIIKSFINYFGEK